MTKEFEKIRDRLITQQNAIVQPLPVVPGSYTSIRSENKKPQSNAEIALQMEINELSETELIQQAMLLAELFPDILRTRTVTVNDRELILTDENEWKIVQSMNGRQRE